MEAQILKHKTLEGYHAIILNGFLYRTGPGIIPGFFSLVLNFEDIKSYIRHIDPNAGALEDYELVKVRIEEIPISELPDHKGFLHRHPMWENRVQLGDDHVIVDKGDWEKVRRQSHE